MVVTPPTPSAGARGACPTTAEGVTVVVDLRPFDRSVHVRCAPGSPASGLAALTRAQFTYRLLDAGGALCYIEGLPRDHDCTVDPAAEPRWSHWHSARGGSWTAHDTGAGDRAPPVGSVEGWAFGFGDPPSVPPPPPPATSTTTAVETAATTAPVATAPSPPTTAPASPEGPAEGPPSDDAATPTVPGADPPGPADAPADGQQDHEPPPAPPEPPGEGEPGAPDAGPEPEESAPAPPPGDDTSATADFPPALLLALVLIVLLGLLAGRHARHRMHSARAEHPG